MWREWLKFRASFFLLKSADGNPPPVRSLERPTPASSRKTPLCRRCGGVGAFVDAARAPRRPTAVSIRAFREMTRNSSLVSSLRFEKRSRVFLNRATETARVRLSSIDRPKRPTVVTTILSQNIHNGIRIDAVVGEAGALADAPTRRALARRQHSRTLSFLLSIDTTHTHTHTHAHAHVARAVW